MKPLRLSEVLRENATQNAAYVKKITLTSKGYTEIEDLRKCDNLDRVELSNNAIADANGLSNCKKISWLNLTRNQIDQVSFCAKLKSLTVLKLSSNKIQDLSPLQTLGNVKALILNDNQIKEVKCLTSMIHLNTLVLSHNQIEEIEVSHLSHLTKLQLSHNKFKEFPDVRCNFELKIISLNSNKVKAVPVEYIGQNERLEQLDLGNNKIKKIKNITVIENISRLTNLNLLGNPICETEGWLDKVSSLVPSLKVLNSKPKHKWLELAKKNADEDKVGGHPEADDKFDEDKVGDPEDDDNEREPAPKRKLEEMEHPDVETTVKKVKKKKRKQDEVTQTETIEESETVTSKKKKKKKKHKEVVDDSDVRRTKECKSPVKDSLPSKATSSGVVKIKEIKKNKHEVGSEKKDIFSSLEVNIGTGTSIFW